MKRQCKSIYKTAREYAGLTQEKAVELLHVSVRQLSAYETGETAVPDQMVCKMAEVYVADWLAYKHLRQATEIGQRFLPDIGDFDIARAVLRFKKEVRDLDKIDCDMVDIACDGVIDKHEEHRWGKVVKEVNEVVGAALTIMFAKKEKSHLRSGRLKINC